MIISSELEVKMSIFKPVEKPTKQLFGKGLLVFWVLKKKESHSFMRHPVATQIPSP